MQDQQQYHASGKTAAKNTLMLYIQMLFSLFVGLYTSRVVLQVLGVSDYGLQNVIGGVVTLFTFFNSTLTSGTQRFMSYAIGEGDIQKAKKVFSATLTIHLFMAIIVCIITEIGGLYLIHHQMQIPEGRMYAALWLFHMSVISLFISISQVPFNAAIVAHEKMGAFAFLSIFDTVFRLLIVFAIQIIDGYDKLIMYATLGFVASLVNLVINRWMCIRWFEEARFKFGWDKPLYKEIMTFSGWNVMGCLAVTGSNEGINVLLNMFYGTVINAARGIAVSVAGYTTRFVGGFTSAINPQIVKSYAAGNIDDMWRLTKMSALYASFLIIIFAVPIWLEVAPVLQIWLGQVPEHTVFFSRVIIIQTIINTISRPFVACVHATGRMKMPNLTSGSCLLLIVPVSYVLMKLGASPETVYVVNVLPWVAELGFDMYFVHEYTGVHTSEMITVIIKKVVLIILASTIPSYLVQQTMDPGFVRVVVVTIVSLMINLPLMFYWGLDKNMQTKVFSIINKKILRR